MSEPRVSIVIPAYNEGEQIVPVLVRVLESVSLSHEVLVVVDDPTDSTVAVIAGRDWPGGTVRVAVNTYGPGPANAIRFGIDAATAPVTIVTMADGSDDPRQIDALARLVERGVVVAAASRYMPGGQQVGGRWLKTFLSRSAGLTLAWFARVGTRDATNSFKAYSTDFVRDVGIDSRHGFEIGLELVAKARRRRLPVAELPTIWLERETGVTNFRMAAWIPRYLHWYLYAFGVGAPTGQDPRMEARDGRRRDVRTGHGRVRVHRRLRRRGAAGARVPGDGAGRPLEVRPRETAV